MKLKFFPDPFTIIDPDGIALMSDEMSVEILKEAYSNGIFPWPHDDLPTLWFCPQFRGILKFSDLHISRSLIKSLKKNNWQLSTNQDFESVIKHCASQYRPGQGGTWINDHIISHYLDFHKAGFVHSFECRKNGNLIGGMYGVFINGIFSGESMFFNEPNASKASFLFALMILQKLGLQWIDIQMVTEHMSRFGGKEIDRVSFLNLKKLSQKKDLKVPNINLSLSEVLKYYLK